MFKTKKFIAVVAICMVALLAFSACGGGKKEASASGGSASGSSKSASSGKAPKANPITDFKYELNEDGESVYIYDYIGTSSTVVFPAEIEGFPVTTIQWKTCIGNEEITDVVIPEGIKRISGSFSLFDAEFYGAFQGCTSLKSVKLPESLESIGCYVFEGCKSLTDTNIPASIKEIYEGAFADCLLSNLTIPDSIQSIEFTTETWIGDDAFEKSQPPLAMRKRLQDLGYKGSF